MMAGAVHAGRGVTKRRASSRPSAGTIGGRIDALLPATMRDLVAALHDVSYSSVHSAVERHLNNGSVDRKGNLYVRRELVPRARKAAAPDPDGDDTQEGNCELVGFGFDAAQAPTMRCPSFGRVPIAQCIDDYTTANAFGQGHKACRGCPTGRAKREAYGGVKAARWAR